MRYVFIINPVAGKGKKQEKIANEITEFFSGKQLDFKVCFTKYQGDAKVIAENEVKSGEKTVVFACGGEGTSFEVLNGIIGYENAVMGVVPCGSANDFLKFFDENDSFLNFDEQINGEIVDIDLIKAGENYCLNGCSVGMDAIVAKNMIFFKKWPFVKGSLAYKLAIVKTFLGKIGLQLKIKLDDEDLGNHNCLFAVIANAPYYGGGFMGAPYAVPNDNKLNFTLVKKISRLSILKFLPTYENGEHEGLDFCKLSECEQLEISSENDMPINLDGEIIFSKAIKFSLVKNGIKFLLPKKAAKKLLINV